MEALQERGPKFSRCGEPESHNAAQAVEAWVEASSSSRLADLEEMLRLYRLIAAMDAKAPLPALTD
jgi:hypothetical protein